MSVLLAEATVKVDADVNGVGPGAEQSMRRQGGLFSKIGAITGGILGAAVVMGAGRAIKSVFSTGLAEAKDASAGAAQLAAGIKSTGNAAKVSVKELMARAGAIQALSGQTDDSIVKTQSLLLTFTNISNAGPDKIFDRATLAAANMAARLGGDAAGSATRLGKALNDPVAGISALTKVGVQFTEQQKDQIKAMVAVGDTAGAQKVILAELDKQFGGSAAAAGQSLPGVLERIKRGFEDVTQVVAEHFIPNVLPGLQWLADKAGTAGDAVDRVLDGMDNKFGKIDLGKIIETAASFSPLLTVIDQLKPLFPTVLDAIKPILPVVADLAKTLGGELADVISTSLVPALADIITQIAPLVPVLAVSLGGAIKELLPSLGDLVKSIIPLLPVIVDLAVQALPLVIGAIELLIPVIKWVAEYWGGLFTAVDMFFKLLSGDKSMKQTMFDISQMKGPIGDLLRVAQDMGTKIGRFFGDVKRNAKAMGDGFSSIFKGIGKVVGDTFSNVVNFVKGGINNVIGLVNLGIKALNKFKVTLPAALGGATIGLNIPRIPLLAKGSRNAPDTFIAGEAGPELITGARGSRVYSNSETREMLGGGGGVTIANLTVVLDAKNVREFNDVVEMVAALPQVARAGRGVSVRG